MYDREKIYRPEIEFKTSLHASRMHMPPDPTAAAEARAQVDPPVHLSPRIPRDDVNGRPRDTSARDHPQRTTNLASRTGHGGHYIMHGYRRIFTK